MFWLRVHSLWSPGFIVFKPVEGHDKEAIQLLTAKKERGGNRREREKGGGGKEEGNEGAGGVS